jgi:hypothetical protein
VLLASLSGLATGLSVDHFGYSPTFLAAGGAAAFTVCCLLMPETAAVSDVSAMTGSIALNHEGDNVAAEIFTAEISSPGT